MHHEIAKYRPELTALCRRYGVVRLEVFGSAVRADFDPGSSDADFLVKFKLVTSLSPLEQFFSFAEAFTQLLGRPVDLVEAGAIKNPFILERINRSREIVYGS